MTESTTFSGLIAPELHHFALSEAKLVRAAAQFITDKQKQELTALGALLMQCARVGDIDRNLATDRKIEELIGLAAKMPEAANLHSESKVDFKKAWRSSHALRDSVPAVQMRIDQIQRIVAGDSEGAAAFTDAFFASVSKAL